MEKLISMTDYVIKEWNGPFNTEVIASNCLRYAEFLKRPLKLEMFVPCDDDGSFLKEPQELDKFCKGYECTCENDSDFERDCSYIEYKKAKEKVLFDGFEVIHEDKVRITIQSGFLQLDYSKNTDEFKNYSTIEDFTYLGLTLSDSANK